MLVSQMVTFREIIQNDLRQGWLWERKAGGPKRKKAVHRGQGTNKGDSLRLRRRARNVTSYAIWTYSTLNF